MKSPFLGMDSYLESDIWIDIHHNLASEIQATILPFIVPKYIAKVEPYTIKDKSASEDIGIMYPDMAVLEKENYYKLEEPTILYGTAVVASKPSLLLPNIEEIEVRIPSIKIYDRQSRELITAIEILSPVNKREPQLSSYRKKRRAFREAGVHLLEIDLIRRGISPCGHPRLPQTDYRVILIRADQHYSEIWTFQVEDKLPILPVPLRSPDSDVTFDLGKAIHSIYERNYYHLSINYEELPPPPVFEEERQKWIEEKIKEWKKAI